jgi:hypothetical protein
LGETLVARERVVSGHHARRASAVGGYQEVAFRMSGGMSKTGLARSQNALIAVLAITTFLLFFGIGLFVGWIMP